LNSEIPVPIEIFDLAIPNNDFTAFIPLGYNVSLNNTQQCINFNGSGPLILFPVGLIQGWETTSFITTVDPSDLAIIFIGIGCYLVVLVFVIYHFFMHVIHREIDKPFWSLAKVALLLLIIFLFNRIIYLLLLPNGVFEQVPEVDSIFSEFPALIYFSIYTLIVLRWAEIYHYSMNSAGPSSGLNQLKPALFIINGIVLITFIVIMILFFVIPDRTITVICVTQDTELDSFSPDQIVGIVYKCVFAVFCIGLSIAFLFYGIKVVLLITASKNHMVNDDEKFNEKKRMKQDALTKMLSVTCVCTLTLLGQAANLIDGSFTRDRSLLGVLIFLYVIEIPSSIIFIVLFKRTSKFTPKTSTSNVSSTRMLQPTPSVTNSRVSEI